ncbi:hypothetical protein KQI79_13650 [Paenibacillus sp. MSJ-34]|nr:MauE/DoxX family redox-associated membrane protein [Paenibacillus sp. MSJ-34]MBU5443068.1 hypothetical protein [Paenibacillus sp. MSJ-34]
MDMTMPIQLLVCTVFVSTGISKLFAMSSFEEAIVRFTSIRNALAVRILSATTVALEIGCAVLLLVPIVPYHIPEIVLMAMLLFFSILIAYHLFKKTKLTCHCGGLLGNEPIGVGIPIRNALLFIGLGWTIVAPASPSVVERLKHAEQWQMLALTELLVLCLLTAYYFIQKVNALMKENASSQ